MEEQRVVIIEIRGGLPSLGTMPANTRVVIRDYDCEAFDSETPIRDSTGKQYVQYEL